MSPEAQALYDELEVLIEKTRASGNYRFTPQAIKEFIGIKQRHSPEAFDELLALRIKIKNHNQGGEY